MDIFGQELVITTLEGLEEVLEKELQAMGIEQTEQIKRGVVIPYSQKNLYKTNVSCRVSMRVLAPVFTFEANDTDELYEKALALPWTKYQDVNQTFAIYHSINSKIFTHSQYATFRIKDALCDAFRKENDRRPNVETRRPDIYWNLHIYENKVTVSLDSSGDSLHLRGYRRGFHGAPINEVLACGLIYLSCWNPDLTPFVDGMTGSGTIAIEAAMMATRRAPNLKRRFFAFKNWKNHDENLFQEVRKTLVQRSRSTSPEIVAIDVSPRAIQTAQTHARIAGVDKHVRFIKGDFLDYKPHQPKGVLLMNPPYGERIEIQDLDMLYREIGTNLKHEFPGWTAGIISSDKDALQAIGLNSFQTHHLLNGKLLCDFKLYELFEGKKKDRN